VTEHATTAPRVFVLLASAGGHDAVAELLERVGPRSPHVFVVVIKASEGPSMLQETIALRTPIQLCRVEGSSVLTAGVAYLAGPGARLRVGRDSIASQPREPGVSSMDMTLRSAAEAWGDRVTAVVLAGGEAKVHEGLRAVLDVGGSVYCQSPPSAAVAALPASVLREVGATGVGSCAEISGWIRDGLSPEVRDTGDPECFEASLPPAFWTLLETLRGSLGVDPYAYRTATLYRRAMQRVRTLGCGSLEAYVERVLTDADEAHALGSRLLIGTTDFFRNASLFEDLRALVVPVMLRQPTLSVWCAGCSTGEEAYSVAAFLLSEFSAAGSTTRVRITATDARPGAIETASAGVYPLARVENMPPELRSKYGTEDGKRWRVGDTLRDAVQFSVHDVLSDPPPGDRDLVLFRNVMIYLRPDVHPRALARMHQALRPGGFLAVGESESTHSLEGAFTRVHYLHGAMLQRA
jgi:two-component system CheB/CheR fusion protein